MRSCYLHDQFPLKKKMMDLSLFSNTIWANRRMFEPKTKGSMAIILKLSVTIKRIL